MLKIWKLRLVCLLIKVWKVEEQEFMLDFRSCWCYMMVLAFHHAAFLNSMYLIYKSRIIYFIRSFSLQIKWDNACIISINLKEYKILRVCVVEKNVMQWFIKCDSPDPQYQDHLLFTKPLAPRPIGQKVVVEPQSIA